MNDQWPSTAPDRSKPNQHLGRGVQRAPRLLPPHLGNHHHQMAGGNGRDLHIAIRRAQRTAFGNHNRHVPSVFFRTVNSDWIQPSPHTAHTQQAPTRRQARRPDGHFIRTTTAHARPDNRLLSRQGWPRHCRRSYPPPPPPPLAWSALLPRRRYCDLLLLSHTGTVRRQHQHALQQVRHSLSSLSLCQNKIKRRAPARPPPRPRHKGSALQSTLTWPPVCANQSIFILIRLHLFIAQSISRLHCQTPSQPATTDGSGWTFAIAASGCKVNKSFIVPSSSSASRL